MENSSFEPENTDKIFRNIKVVLFILVVGFFLLIMILGSISTPEDELRRYRKTEKINRDYEKKNKEIEEYYEFIGGQE